MLYGVIESLFHPSRTQSITCENRKPVETGYCADRELKKKLSFHLLGQPLLIEDHRGVFGVNYV